MIKETPTPKFVKDREEAIEKIDKHLRHCITEGIEYSDGRDFDGGAISVFYFPLVDRVRFAVRYSYRTYEKGISGSEYSREFIESLVKAIIHD